MKFLLSLFLATNLLQAAEKPNIVFFFVDEMGWSDLGYRNLALESTSSQKRVSISNTLTFLAPPAGAV